MPLSRRALGFEKIFHIFLRILSSIVHNVITFRPISPRETHSGTRTYQMADGPNTVTKSWPRSQNPTNTVRLGAVGDLSSISLTGWHASNLAKCLPLDTQTAESKCLLCGKTEIQAHINTICSHPALLDLRHLHRREIDLYLLALRCTLFPLTTNGFGLCGNTSLG
jgi:hypothetical protein